MSERIISTAAEATAWLASQRFCAGPWGWDTETEGLDPRKQPAAGDNGRIVCFTVASPVGIDSTGQLEATAAFFWAVPEVLAVIGPWWSTATLVGHNLYGFDAHMARKAGYPLRNIVMDTLRAHRLISTDPDAKHGLKALMELWLGIEPVGKLTELFSRRKCLEVVPDSEIKNTWRKVDDQPRVPTLVGGAHSRFGELTELIPLSSIESTYPHLLSDLYRYACLDAVATLKLWFEFERRMAKTVWIQDFDV